MQIAIELPNDFVALQETSQVQQEIRISYAMWLFQQARVTLSKAAQLAGLDAYEFMAVCKANKVSTIDVSPEELANELLSLNAAA